jgi:A/G-specific adenine glycosylase
MLDEAAAVTAGDPAGDDIAGPLLSWYDRHRRDLPWRTDPSPYKTGVATVIPFFDRFTTRFPDVHALAGAEESAVTAAWAGLGYYARARNLHRAARAVVEQHGGILPGEETALRTLPGVGPYTASAIAAIAFGRRVFALDGNAIRVVARLLGDRGQTHEPGVRDRFRLAGSRWVPPERAGDFAQAVMELGATICRPRQPTCAVCPLAGQCVAARTGRVGELPARRPRGAKLSIRWVALRIRARERVAVGQRPSGLLAGTWMLPSLALGARRRPDEAAAQLARSIGLPAPAPRRVGEVRHVFTHRELTVTLFECAVPRRPQGLLQNAAAGVQGPWRWVTAGSAGPAGVALSSLTKKLLRLPMGPS